MVNFAEYVELSENQEIAQFLQGIAARVLQSAHVVDGKVGFSFSQVPISQAAPTTTSQAPAMSLAAHTENPGTTINEGRPKLPGSEQDWANRHKKGWQAWKSLSQIGAPTWDNKQQTLFKNRLTKTIEKISQPLGFLFEAEVFLYLESKGFHDADSGEMGVPQIKAKHVTAIQKHTGTASALILQMVSIHAQHLGDQMEAKTKKLLGCADMIWYAGGTDIAWKTGRNSPADIYIGCSSSTEDKTGYSVKFGTETRIQLASLTPQTALSVLGGSARTRKGYVAKHNPSAAESEKEWNAIMAEMMADAAEGIDPIKFTKILNYLLTGNRKVLPAFRNYASTEMGGAEWSGNIQKDFVVTNDLENPLRPKKGSQVEIDHNATYMRMTYKVPNGSFSGTTIYFWPQAGSTAGDGKINVKVNNLTSSRR